MTVPAPAYLAVAAVLFAIGVYAVLAQRTAVMVLMGVEVLLNAAALDLVVFWRTAAPADYGGQIFVIILVTVGAIEMAVGLGLMMLLYRRRRTVQIDRYRELSG